MDIQIFQYNESQLEEIRLILTEYMTFIANEMIKPPWGFNEDVEHEVRILLGGLSDCGELVGVNHMR